MSEIAPEKKIKDLLCRVTHRRLMAADVFELTFSTEPTFVFKAGQFMSIIVPGAGPNGRDLRRAYSIASHPERETPQICVRLVPNGPGTNYLFKLKEGDSFKAMAPYGDFVYKTAPGRHVLFIATGTGIAPFRSMMLSESFKTAAPLSTTCLLGVRDESELLYDDEIKDLQGIHWIPALSRSKSPGPHFSGRVTDYLRKTADKIDWLKSDFYLCGNGAMIDEVKKMLWEKGVQKANVFQEIYYKPKAELS